MNTKFNKRVYIKKLESEIEELEKKSKIITCTFFLIFSIFILGFLWHCFMIEHYEYIISLKNSIFNPSELTLNSLNKNICFCYKFQDIPNIKKNNLEKLFIQNKDFIIDSILYMKESILDYQNKSVEISIQQRQYYTY